MVSRFIDTNDQMGDVAEEDESIDHVGYSVSEEENGVEQVQHNI